MPVKDKNKEYRVDGDRLVLRLLQESDASEAYLSWMNDAEVQKLTRRRGKKSEMKDVEEFIRYAIGCSDFHFAIIEKESGKHIGNISLNSIDEQTMSGEVSIMLGDRSVWGKGYGTDAVRMITDFAFNALQLHRVWAESPNPAFNKLMQKLGWKNDGTKQQAFLTDEGPIDLECWSLLRNDRNG